MRTKARGFIAAALLAAGCATSPQGEAAAPKDVAPAAPAPDAPAAPAAVVETPKAPTQPPAPDKFEFRLAAKPGDAFCFRQQMNIDQTVHVSGMDVSTTIEYVQFSKWTVSALRDDGGADCTQTFGRCHGKIENPMMGTIEFDSAKPTEADDSNPMAKAMSAMSKGFTALPGSAIEMRLSRGGDIVELKGMKEILKKALGGAGGGPAGGMAGMDAMLDDEGFKQQMRQGMGAVPEGGAAVGQTWASDASVAQPIQMTVHTDYSLASVDAEKAVIETKLKMTTDNSKPGGTGLAGVTLKITDAKGTGSITRSRKDGLVLVSATEVAMSMDITAPQMQGQTMQSEQKTTTRIERIAADAYEAQPAAPPVTPSPSKK